MQGNKKIILQFSLGLTITASTFALAAIVLLIVSIAASFAFLIPLSVAMFVAAMSIMIQNKRILLEKNSIVVHHFLGIIKDMRISPVECGLFVSEGSLFQKPVYLDKRVIRADIFPESGRYIYISEYILSKEEQEGSQYVHGEPLLILPYSEELYSALAEVFEFNCEPFGK